MSESLFVNTQEAEPGEEKLSLGLAPGEIVLGILKYIDDNGSPHVHFPQMDADTSLVAVSTLAVSTRHVGRQVALLFANGDLQKPIIMGFIHSPLNELLENFSMLQQIEVVAGSEEVEADVNPFEGHELALPEKNAAIETIKVDGKRVVIEGQEEIVLACGESSITLTRAGKILIRGKYLLSRSSGVNRILGGSVQVN
ncbi:MAG TPA: DUF6484 domain-containing protein [Cellvibrio sp.]|nr:DUF6484 domain-containing protein [Cellvibrio sp.]